MMERHYKCPIGRIMLTFWTFFNDLTQFISRCYVWWFIHVFFYWSISKFFQHFFSASMTNWPAWRYKTVTRITYSVGFLNLRKRFAFPVPNVGAWIRRSARSPEYWFSAVEPFRRNAVISKQKKLVWKSFWTILDASIGSSWPCFYQEKMKNPTNVLLSNHFLSQKFSQLCPRALEKKLWYVCRFWSSNL